MLLSRTAQSLDPIVAEINESGGKAIGIPTDVSSKSSMDAAVKSVHDEFGNAGCAAAVFNASAGFRRAPFLETTVEDFTKANSVSLTGAFIFAQSALPMLLETAERTKGQFPPTLVFTGATASVKSSAIMSSTSTGKWAQRALAQSLAKEFGPKRVYVGHGIIDGVIDIPKSKDFMADVPDGKISPAGIAEAYWLLHTQPRSCWTHEVDLR